MQRIIDCYRMNGPIQEILAQGEERKAVELWLKNHPLTESPLLSDLRRRIAPVPPTLYSLAASLFDWFQGPGPEAEIESKILAGKGDELIAPFRKSPSLFLEHIDLIKMHIELKTLSVNEAWLALLLDQAPTRVIKEILNLLPPPTEYIHRLRLNFIKEMPCIILPIINEEKEYANLAFYMERQRLPLNYAKQFLSDEELFRLTPYLRYVDFSAFENIELAQKFLKSCANPTQVRITTGRILEGISSLSLCEEFDCHRCHDITALPKLPHCRELNCASCKSLEALPPLPRCQKLNCSRCDKLTVIPPLPHCQKLECGYCTEIKALGALPLCKELICSSCHALTALPDLPLCEKLHCDGCCDLKSPGGALPLCQDLTCEACTSLQALPDLPQCQDLDCSGCTALKVLPALPLCESMRCDLCSALTALPELPQCVMLQCSESALKALPSLALCQTLLCPKCPELTALPPLPLCETLSCFHCPRLTALPPLPQCRELYCHHCTGLSDLPGLPRCRELHCAGCFLRELPEIPWGAQVYAAEETGLAFTALKIDIERISTEPVELLLLLGEHLLKKKPFPNIYYFEKGVRNFAVDYGGIRRDFVTKLCLNLFNELKMDDNFPSAGARDESAYRSLGALMAYCYPANSFYKTGPLFDPEVYGCMLTPLPGSNQWYLTNYLRLVKAPESARQLIDLSQKVPDLKDHARLAYLADTAAGDLTKYTPHYFATHREELRTTLLARAKQDPRLKAIAWMALEMRKRVPKLEENLKERVEGILNQEALKRKLTYTGPRIEFLTNWIDTHADQLDRFVYAVTGNRTLCANDLKIEVYDRHKEFIPVAHTCFFSLELSSNYESQAVFDQKMAYFLENALAGSGFTLA